MTDCIFMGGLGCLILKEKDCPHKQCSFYKNRNAYEQEKERDYLYESYLKGDISKERYAELAGRYHKEKISKENIL